MRSTANDRRLRLEKKSSDIVTAVKTAWDDYRYAVLWIQEACRRQDGRSMTFQSQNSTYSMCSRLDFRNLYEYLLGGGLEFQYIAFAPNVTGDLRPAFEQEARDYYSVARPDLEYSGFIGSRFDPNSPTLASFAYRTPQPFYFPQHMIEPSYGNEFMIGYDLYSAYYSYLIDEATMGWKPVISNPIPSGRTKFVILLHPGIRLSGSNETIASGLSIAAVSFTSLLKRATTAVSDPVRIYIFDVSSPIVVLYGGYKRYSAGHGMMGEEFINDKSLDDLRMELKSETAIETNIMVEHQTWKVFVVDEGNGRTNDLLFIALSGALIYVACFCVSLWLYAVTRKAVHIAEIKRKADAEKAALIVANAERTARRERNMNEYLAHEVRNPLSAAMSACNFLSFAYQGLLRRIQDFNPSSDNMQEDIDIINNSLQFIYDLLRSTLDMHKALDGQMTLVKAPTDILKDILDPVKAIIHRKSNSFLIEIECPKGLVLNVDRMRLKQIILNLAGNSKKFVQQGFIRLGAKVSEEGFVQMYVEDSGPGIPPNKRVKVFSRFQESLDSLNQGTGVGLSLCKTLVELMGGTIQLDETYDSGIEGFSGTRFVIDLKDRPMSMDLLGAGTTKRNKSSTGPTNSGEKATVFVNGEQTVTRSGECNNPLASIPRSQRKLPCELSVLVVDDDMILRKLLSRSLRRVAPDWKIQEAASGEAALQLAETVYFDLVFLDQYMASVERQLLGTETVQALRAKGIRSKICGLSANNLEAAFLNAGADAFLLKPFSCDKDALEGDLLRVLGLQ